MFEIIPFLILGIIIGAITGLTPGLHINTINSILLSSPLIAITENKLSIVTFIVSMAATHSVLDIIPSIFLGAPNEESYLTTLPGHEMLREGRGLEAVYISIIGIILAIPIILIISPIFIKLVPVIFNKVVHLIPFLLIFLSIYLISRENYSLTAVTIFLMSGLVGYLSLNLPIRDNLLPLLSGLFGGSGIILSLKDNQKINLQKEIKLKQIILTKKEYSSSIVSSTISAPLFSFLPAIGAGHAATLSTEVFPQTRKSFLMTVNCINTIVNTLSFATLYVIGKTRTGASAALGKIFPNLTLSQLMFIFSISIISILISAIMTIRLSANFSKIVSKINYKFFSTIVLIILIIIVFIFSGFLGILVFVTSTSIGIFCIQSKVRRINLMGCLILPTILIYLF